MTPGSPEWEARLAAAEAEEAKHPLCWWYLSFAEPERFLGGCFVQARGLISALRRATALGINPGGEVAALQIHVDGIIPRGVKNRLLTADELEKDDLLDEEPQ